MVEREAKKNVPALEVGRTCSKALSQEGNGEFRGEQVGLVGQAKDFRNDLQEMGIHGISPGE